MGYLDTDFFVYSEEVDFQKRMHDAGWRILHVPRAARDPPRAARHRPLAGGRRGSSSSTAAATSTCESTIRRPSWRLSRLLWSWSYVPRALAAAVPARPGPGRPGSTPARRCDPAAARACARRPTPTTGNSTRIAAGRVRSPSGPRRGRRLVDLGPESVLVLVGPGVSRRRAQALGRARRSRTGVGARPGRCAPPRGGSRRGRGFRGRRARAHRG